MLQLFGIRRHEDGKAMQQLRRNITHRSCPSPR
jgi:hypothetical protein